MEREVKSKKSLRYMVLLIIGMVMMVVCSVMAMKNYLEEKSEKEKGARTVFQRQIMEKEDGWYYFLDKNRTELQIGQYQYYYSFGGCNLKYETLADNYATITDNTTGEILSTMPKTPPSLSTSYRSKNGKKTEKQELIELNQFFQQKQIPRKLTADDLKEIEFVNFDPDDIVTLWNQSDDSKYLHQKEFGPYPNLVACNYLKNDSSNNYFQVGVMVNYGLIQEVRMDYINETKEYLTDKMESQTASKEEQELYKNMQNMEKTIIEKQSFAIEDSYPDLKTNSFYTPLFDLLNQYEAKK